MSEEDKKFFEKFIMQNPFDFKSGIINHCRTLAKIDVYDWVAEDELKIQKLNQRIDKAIEIIESYNLGKYDYSIPPGGITDLLDLLRGKDE